MKEFKMSGSFHLLQSEASVFLYGQNKFKNKNDMATLKLNKFILLPCRAASALVRCGFPVSAGIMMKTFSPDTGRIFYENAVCDFLLHKFPEIVRWYEDCPCPTGFLTAGSPVWVFLPEEGKEGDELLRSVRKEIDNRPIRVITRENYRRRMCLSGQLIKRLDRAGDDMLSEFLCHTLLSKQDGTYVDSRRWESAKKGDPVHGFISDMLAACLSARLPIVDGDLPGILTRMARHHIPSVRAKLREQDRMILQACPSLNEYQHAMK